MQVRSLQGDTVDLLCFRHLGRTAGVTEATLQLNRDLAARGPVLPAGVLVTLPEATSVAAPPTLQLWD